MTKYKFDRHGTTVEVESNASDARVKAVVEATEFLRVIAKTLGLEMIDVTLAVNDHNKLMQTLAIVEHTVKAFRDREKDTLQ